MLRMKVKLDDPTPPGRFLGCCLSPFGSTARLMMWTLAVGHRAMGRDQREAAPYPVPSPGQTARGYVYHMEEYTRECVDLYCSLFGISKHRLKHGVKTPVPDEPKETPCWVDEEIGGCIDWAATKAKKNMARNRTAVPTPKAFPKRLQPLRIFNDVIPSSQGRNNSFQLCTQLF